jgi:NTE family protein
MNEIVANGHAEGTGAHEPIRSVMPLAMSPSEDLALVAQRFAHRMPRLLRYVLDGLGTPDAQSADLMSYLLFDAAYTRTLVDLGRRDAEQRITELEAFMAAAPPPVAAVRTLSAVRRHATSTRAPSAPPS